MDFKKLAYQIGVVCFACFSIIAASNCQPSINVPEFSLKAEQGYNTVALRWKEPRETDDILYTVYKSQFLSEHLDTLERTKAAENISGYYPREFYRNAMYGWRLVNGLTPSVEKVEGLASNIIKFNLDPETGMGTNYFNIVASKPNLGIEEIYKEVAVSVTGPPIQPPNRHGSFSIISSNIQCLEIVAVGVSWGPGSADKCFNAGTVFNTMEDWQILAVQENFDFNLEFRDGLNGDVGKDFTRATSHDVPVADKRGNGVDIFMRDPMRGGNTPFFNELGPYKTVYWEKCAQNSSYNCSARKGFRIAEIQTSVIPPNIMIFHLYNLHMDAGSDSSAQSSRENQMNNLVYAIKLNSNGIPVILVGDFNVSINDDSNFFQPLRDMGFVSAAQYDPDGCAWCGKNRVDQIWYRSSGGVTFSHTADDFNPFIWVSENPDDPDEQKKYTDHPAVKLRLNWSTESI